MYGLQSVKTLGIRVGQNLNNHIAQAAKLLRRSRSEVTRAALEAFFEDSGDLRKELKLAARRNGKR